MTEFTLNVGGMTCEGCERSIAKALGRIDGVHEVHADHRTGRVTVEAAREIPADLIAAAIDDAGYVLVPPGSSSLPLV